MIGIAPIFLTFTAISIGLWASMRFSVFIPKNDDEEIFNSIIGRVSNLFMLSAIFFLIFGVFTLLIEVTPEGEMMFNMFFLVFFAYVCYFLLLGLKRLDKIWPGRRVGNFEQLLSYIKVDDYKRRMALKLYEAYIESEIIDRKKIAKYITNLLIL